MSGQGVRLSVFHCCGWGRRTGRLNVPSSLAGESVDLVEEDDGRSDGPRLPKHLQPGDNRKEGNRATV